jgi:hypothetical protein
MIETKEKQIDGATYTVTQLPARRAIRLKARLIKLFGPVFAQFFLAVSENVSDDQRKQDIVKSIEILGAHIDENSFESLVMDLLVGVRKNGMELSPATIDLEFAGDMAALYQLLFFVIEVNFSNFFSMIGIGSQFNSETSMPTKDTKKIFTRK